MTRYEIDQLTSTFDAALLPAGLRVEILWQIRHRVVKHWIVVSRSVPYRRIYEPIAIIKPEPFLMKIILSKQVTDKSVYEKLSQRLQVLHGRQVSIETKDGLTND